MNITNLNNKNRWDSFIEKTAPHSFFQYWNWGDVERSSGKPIWRFGIFQNKTLVGVSQIVKINARRGTFLHVRHGPIFKPNQEESVKRWVEFIIELGRQERAWFIRISPLVEPEQSSFWNEFGFIPSPIHRMDAEVVSVIDTQKHAEELLANMRKTTRYLIKKAEKMGVVVQKSKNINEFLTLYETTLKRHRFVPHHAISTEFEMLEKKDEMDLFTTSFNGNILAGALVAYVGNQGIYRHGASVSSSIPASYLLQWKVIEEVKTRNLPFYNLWGIADTENKNHPWYGLTQFKQGFGGKKQEYMHAHDLPIHPLYRFSHTVERIRKRLRGY